MDLGTFDSNTNNATATLDRICYEAKSYATCPVPVCVTEWTVVELLSSWYCYFTQSDHRQHPLTRKRPGLNRLLHFGTQAEVSFGRTGPQTHQTGP